MATRPLVAAMCVVLFTPVPGRAQERTGTVSGTLRDRSGAVLPEVVIEAQGQALVRPEVAHTDTNGDYTLPALPPGCYTLTATLAKFRPGTISDVQLLVGQHLHVNITLDPAGVSEQVTVSGRPTLVDAGHAAAYSTIDRPTIEMLPGDRDLTSLLKIAPGVGTGVAANGIDGATNLETKIVVDGLETSDPWYWVSGVDLLTSNAQEIQVKASGQTAEFRAGTGGVVNVVTRSGSNGYSGGGGTYFTDSRLQARAHPPLQTIPTDPANPYPVYPGMPYRTWEPWVEIGGPIVKDRAWFFGYYSPYRYSLDTTATFKSTGERRTIRSTITRDEPTWSVTTQLSAAVRLRAAGMHNVSHHRGTPPMLQPDGTSNSDPGYDYAGYASNYREDTYSATLDFAPAERLQIAATGGATRYNNTSPNVSTAPSWSFIGSNQSFADIPASLKLPTGSCNCEQDPWGNRLDLVERRSLNLSASTQFAWLGRHGLKAGVQLERITNDSDGGELVPHVKLHWDASYWASNGTQNRGTYGYYSIGQNIGVGKVGANNLGFFVQDDWSPTRRLTVNAGIRADRENLPAYRQGQQGIHFGFGDKISPRAGLAWDVRGDSRWRVYGSVGRFQDVTKLSVARDQFGLTRQVESYYTLDTYDWRTINCTPWIGGCPGRLIETMDYRIPMTTAKPALQALGYNSQIEPNLKPFQSDEVAVGVEHALRPAVSVGVRYVHKWIDRALDDVGITVPGMGIVRFIANPGFGVAKQVMGPSYPSLPKAVRDYDALEFTFRRRLSGGWMANGSYTWSRVFGNYGGLADVDRNGNAVPNESSAFNTLYGSFDRYGTQVIGELPTSYPHTFKLQAAWQSRWGTSVGLNLVARSGTVQQRFLAQKADRVYFDGRGSLGRTPVYSSTDLRVQQAIRVPGVRRATIAVNVVNLFNQHTVTALQGQVWRDGFNMTDAQFFPAFDPYALAKTKQLRPSPTYGLASDFQPPRGIRLSIGFVF